MARDYATRWGEGFSHLKHFWDQEGHCRVPQRYKTAEGYRLGQWVKVQRTNKTGLNSDRRQRLAAIMHEAARFRTHVERASASNPIIWIGMLLLAVQRAWN